MKIRMYGPGPLAGLQDHHVCELDEADPLSPILRQV